MIPDVFHPLSDLGKNEAENAKFRAFVVEAGEQGRGSKYIELPGCTQVNRVRVGTVEIPPTRTQTNFMQDGDPPKFETIELPNWSLQQGPNGPVLVRSILSNDGYWQGGTVYIDGEFADNQAKK